LDYYFLARKPGLGERKGFGGIITYPFFTRIGLLELGFKLRLEKLKGKFGTKTPNYKPKH